MKTFAWFLCLLLLAGTLAGCARRYNITTTGGRTITTQGKPKYDAANSCFHFTDARGEKRTIPAGSVSKIEPASDTPKSSIFNPEIAR
ncbi:MAG: YgdI/YgdR family lipoprotein [Limisphaerales bacterium]